MFFLPGSIPQDGEGEEADGVLNGEKKTHSRQHSYGSSEIVADSDICSNVTGSGHVRPHHIGFEAPHDRGIVPTACRPRSPQVCLPPEVATRDRSEEGDRSASLDEVQSQTRPCPSDPSRNASSVSNQGSGAKKGKFLWMNFLSKSSLSVGADRTDSPTSAGSGRGSTPTVRQRTGARRMLRCFSKMLVGAGDESHGKLRFGPVLPEHSAEGGTRTRPTPAAPPPALRECDTDVVGELVTSLSRSATCPTEGAQEVTRMSGERARAQCDSHACDSHAAEAPKKFKWLHFLSRSTVFAGADREPPRPARRGASFASWEEDADTEASSPHRGSGEKSSPTLQRAPTTSSFASWEVFAHAEPDKFHEQAMAKVDSWKANGKKPRMMRLFAKKEEDGQDSQRPSRGRLLFR